MGFYKKPVASMDNDEEIRREIRARVAKQVGIYDEEYIQTGKIGGIPVITETKQGEAELSFEPIKVESTSKEPMKVEPISKEPMKVEPISNPAVAKKKQKPVKGTSETGSVKRARKKRINIILILLILILILAFVPVYYYLTGVGTL